ncbi:Lrp/AsnC family transcriptional regulator [Natrononativus amylolyticus]|uniref:Lrp/AsnC family transcriptional regulator n=1 Tax=Natrononativus amylolyticus TaxID=2963434 RepID=UPI0020CF2A1E|nr:Lrp/AsnC family transcriptional regulator [Natrononativus amylolyticus]
MTRTSDSELGDELVVDESIQELVTEHLDEVDYKIYRILNDDGRISDTELGEKVGLSRTAVRRRRRKLQEDNVIKILAVLVLQEVNLKYADVQVTLKSDVTTEEIYEFIEFLLEQELVYEVDEYLGRSDMLVRVWHGSLRDIKRYVNELMQRTDIVDSYEVIPVIKTHKAWHSRVDGSMD